MVIDANAAQVPSGLRASPPNSKGAALAPRELLAAADNRIDFNLLAALAGQSILSAGQFDRMTLIELAKFAALLEITEIASHHPLDGRIVITAFFEASTRTRLSFESAVLRLDGKVLSVADANMTGVAKGESLADIGEMFNAYGDLLIVRHPRTEAIDEIRQNLAVPLINAGNGAGEHPTQALADWYSLLKWRPSLADPSYPAEEKLRLGIIGTPVSMRTVRSFLLLASLFPHAIERISVISERAEPLGEQLESRLQQSGIQLEVMHDARDVLPQLDVVYMNSIALLGGSYQALDSKFRLDVTSPLKPGAVILHPLARRDELDVSLDDTPHNLYFAQAKGAVYIRQALLICMLNRFNALPPSMFFLAG